jgi:membrane-bound metal-dependent hydrolase YbcI (DUF457 family)
MSSWKGHLAGGTIAGLVVAGAYAGFNIDISPAEIGVDNQHLFFGSLVVLSILFSLFPDIDTNSKGQDIFMGSIFVLDALLILENSYQLAAYIGLLAMLPIVGKHRGWTHNRLSMLIVPLPLLLIPGLSGGGAIIAIPYYLASVAGYISHIWLDGLLFRKIRMKFKL